MTGSIASNVRYQVVIPEIPSEMRHSTFRLEYQEKTGPTRVYKLIRLNAWTAWFFRAINWVRERFSPLTGYQADIYEGEQFFDILAKANITLPKDLNSTGGLVSIAAQKFFKRLHIAPTLMHETSPPKPPTPPISIMRPKEIPEPVLPGAYVDSMNLAAHVFGGSLGLKGQPELEGTSHASALQFLLPMAERVASTQEAHELRELLPVFRQSKMLAETLQDIQEKVAKNPALIQQQAELWAKEFAEKRRLVLPGGYCSRRGDAHSIPIDVKFDQKTNTCTVTVYNSGEGIHTHARRQDATKERFAPYRKFTDINPALINQRFFHRLLDLQLGSLVDDQRTFTSNDVYAVILALNGKEVSPSALRADSTAQPAGFCSMKGWLAFLKGNLPRDKYKFFITFAKFQELRNFLAHPTFSGVNKNSALYLELMGLKQFSRALKKARRSNILTEQQYLYYTAEVQKLHVQVAQMREKIPSPIPSRPINVSDVAVREERIRLADIAEPPVLEIAAAKSDAAPFSPISRLDIQGPIAPAHILEVIQNVRKYTASCKTNPAEIEHVLKQFFFALPLPNDVAEKSWRAIPTNDRLQIFQSIKELEALYISAAPTELSAQCVAAIAFLINYHLHSLNDPDFAAMALSMEFLSDKLRKTFETPVYDPQLYATVQRILQEAAHYKIDDPHDALFHYLVRSFRRGAKYHPEKGPKQPIFCAVLVAADTIANHPIPELAYAAKQVPAGSKSIVKRVADFLCANHSTNPDVQNFYLLREQFDTLYKITHFGFQTHIEPGRQFGMSKEQLLHQRKGDNLVLAVQASADEVKLIDASYAGPDIFPAQLHTLRQTTLPFYDEVLNDPQFDRQRLVIPSLLDLPEMPDAEKKEFAQITTYSNLMVGNLLRFFQDFKYIPHGHTQAPYAMQAFIEHVLFHVDALTLIKNDAELQKQVMEWIKKGQETFRTPRDVDTYLFFLSLEASLMKFIQPHADPTELRSNLQWVSKTSNDPIARARAAFLTALTFETARSENDLAECIQSVIAAHRTIDESQLGQHYTLKRLFYATQALLYKHAPMLERSRRLTEQLFSQRVRAAGYAAPAACTIHFPLCTSADGRYQWHILNDIFSIDGATDVPLPSEIRTASDYRELFGDTAVNAKKITENCYRVRDASNNEYEIRGYASKGEHGPKQYAILKKIGTKWYTFTHLNKFPECQFWISDTDAITHNNAAVAISADGRITKRENLGKKDEQALILLVENENPFSRALNNLHSNVDQPIIRYWGVQPNEVAQIELPQCGIHFDIRMQDGEKRAYCREKPGFFIDTHQPGLGTFTNCLFLRNAAGEQKLFFLPVAISARVTTPLLTVPEPEPSERVTTSAILDIRADGTPKATSVQEMIYLAAVYFWQNHEEIAFSYLRQLASSTKQLTDDEINLFTKSLLTMKSHLARPVAFQLQAAAILVKNFRLYEPALSSAQRRKIIDAIDEFYKAYLEHRSFTADQPMFDPLLLNPHTEVMLLQWLDSCSELSHDLAHRLRIVTGQSICVQTTQDPPEKFIEQYQTRKPTGLKHSPDIYMQQYDTDEGLAIEIPQLAALVKKSLSSKPDARNARDQLRNELFFIPRVRIAAFMVLLREHLKTDEDRTRALIACKSIFHDFESPSHVSPEIEPKEASMVPTPKEMRRYPWPPRQTHAVTSTREAITARILTTMAQMPATPSSLKQQKELLEYQAEHKQFTLPQVIGLCLRNNPLEWHEANPFLQEADRNSLFESVCDYLFLATEESAIARAQGKDVPPRAYSIDDPHAFLFALFEHGADIRLRPEQCASLRRILAGEERIDQFIMGAGKTSVFLLILLQYFADGTHLPIITEPEALFASVLEQSKQRLEQVFHHELEPLTFNINTDLDYVSLQRIHKLLQSQIDRHGSIIVVPRTIQDLWIAYHVTVRALAKIEAQKRNDAEAMKLQKNVEVLESILNILHTQGINCIDEVDNVLSRKNIRKLALGEFRPLPDAYFDLYVKLFRSVKKCNSGSLQCTNEQEYLKIKPQISADLVAQPEFLSVALTPQEMSDLAAYMTSKDIPEPRFIQAMSENDRNCIALARKTLNDFLFPILQQSPLEQFGFSHENLSLEIAIPCNASKPIEGAQFALAFETLGKTLKLLDHTRLTVQKVEKWLKDLRTDGFKERREHRRAGRRLELENTAAAQLWRRLCPGVSLYQIDIHNEAELNKIAAIVNANEAAITEYARRYIRKQIGTLEDSLAADTFSFVDMFCRTVGFSGTVSADSRSMHRRLAIHPDTTLRAKIDKVFAAKEKGIQVFADPVGRTLEATINTFCTHFATRKYRAFIDAGAWCKGIPNLTVARALLQSLAKYEKIDALVFYGEDDKKYILRTEHPEPMLFSEYEQLPPEHKVDLSRVFAYFDQAHCIGADIALKADARGFVTTNELTKFSMFCQSSFRLRQFMDGGQSVDVGVHPGMQQDFDALLLRFKNTESDEEKHDNYLAFMQQLEAQVKTILTEQMMHVSLDEKLLLQNHFREFFFQGQKDAPYVQFSGTEQLVATVDQCQKQCDEFLGRLRIAIESFPQQALQKRLQEAFSSTKLLAHHPEQNVLPQHVFQRATALGTQQAVQQQTQVKERAVHGSKMQRREVIDWDIHESIYSKPSTLPSKPLTSLPRFSGIGANIFGMRNFRNTNTDPTSPAHDTASFVLIIEKGQTFEMHCCSQKDADIVYKHLQTDTPQHGPRMCLFDPITNTIYKQAKPPQDLALAAIQSNADARRMLSRIREINRAQ